MKLSSPALQWHERATTTYHCRWIQVQTISRCSSTMCTGYLCSHIINGGLVNVDSEAPGMSQLSKCRCLALQLHWLYWLGAQLPTSRCFPLRNHCVGMSQAPYLLIFHCLDPSPHADTYVATLALRCLKSRAVVPLNDMPRIMACLQSSEEKQRSLGRCSSAWTGRGTFSTQVVTMGELL